MSILAGLLGAALCSIAPQPPDSATDQRVEWLRDHAVPITIPAPGDDDFADLQPLKAAIGDARVVGLGELTHGDGTAFELKVRLIKFLHQQMGFDVLVWESGLYDCEMMDRQLRLGVGGEKPLPEVASLGVFAHWTAGVESFPVFEYARRTGTTPRPLRMAGFDLQPSGRAAGSQSQSFLEWLTPAEGAMDPGGLALIGHLRARVNEMKAIEPGPNREAETDRIYGELSDRAADLASLHRRHEAHLAASIGPAEFGFRQRCFDNAAEFAEMMRRHARFQQSQRGEDFMAAYNLRERVNADNIRWLADERFAGKKLILWAHNAHLFHGLAGNIGLAGSDLPATAQMDDTGTLIGLSDSSGRIAKAALGDAIYMIAVLAHAGTWSWMGNPPITYAPAQPGSIEDLLHQATTGAFSSSPSSSSSSSSSSNPGAQSQGPGAYFCSLRPVRQDPANPLNQPIQGRINQQSPDVTRTVWPTAYDGVLYIETMKPRTQKP